MYDRFLSMSRRIRRTPYTARVEAAGVQAYTSYNHMLLPTVFESLEADYWHLCEHVQVWDVSCERQVELKGPESQKLVQLMTPRDISRAELLQGLYVPLCDVDGSIVNDPIAIKLDDEHWWLSIADSDVRLWAIGLATGYGLDVSVHEAQIWPLAVQGPKADTLMARVFGDEVKSIRFFRGKMLEFEGCSMYVARSGWSKQGGFEIYLNDANLAEPLWDRLMQEGEDLNVRAGCPNLIERMESGLLSFGNDMCPDNNPFECGLDAFINLDRQIDALSLDALRKLEGKHIRQLKGVLFADNQLIDNSVISADDGSVIGVITSQTWSPRYQKFMVFAMFERVFAESNDRIHIGDRTGLICDLPYPQACLEQPLELT